MDLVNLKARELMAGYKNRDFSCEEVTKAYLKNVKEKNEEINAYITICEEEAIKTAKKIDHKLQNREETGELCGAIISVKDNISVKGVRLTCSSKMLENYISPYDSVVAERVKQEDGVILGKVNMDEFAMGATTRTSYFGPTKNPLNTELVPGGSSGGSAASLAANMCSLSIGTDTGGSVRQPASFCGLVGIKPTYGTIPRYGLSTMANTFDQVGSFGKDVEDAYILIKSLEGRDLRDATSVGNDAYHKEIEFDNNEKIIESLKDIKIAIPRQYLDMKLESRIEEDFKKAIEVFKSCGAEIIDVDMESLKHVIETYHILTNGEIAPNMARFDGLRFGHRTDHYTDYEDMYRKSRAEGFGEEVKRRIMIGTHILSLELAKDYYYKALKVRELIKRDFDRVYKEADLVMCPTSPVLPYKISEKMSPVEIYKADLFTIPANMIGAPSISIPMPKVDGLSVGIELTSNRFKDDIMIKAALGLERSMK